MKTLNLVMCIIFALIAITAIIVSIASKHYWLLLLAFIMGATSYVAFQDYKNPEL